MTHRVLHSFPTRRSSDLIERVGADVRSRSGHIPSVRAAAVAGECRERLIADAVVARQLEIDAAHAERRSEEHTSELQSRRELVCRLLLEKKKKAQQHAYC